LQNDIFFNIIIFLIFSGIVLLIIVKIKNYNTEKNIKKMDGMIKPFELNIKKDYEKMAAIEKLQDGDILSKTVYDTDNEPMFSSGIVITEKIKERLFENRIPFVWIKNKKFKGFEKK
jgi:hypothetical protein